MNRRTFLAKLVAGIAALPVIGKLCAQPVKNKPYHGMLPLPHNWKELFRCYQNAEDYAAIQYRGGIVQTRPGAKRSFTLPEEAGEFKAMKIVDGKMIMLMENGVWVSDAPFNSCRKVLV